MTARLPRKMRRMLMMTAALLVLAASAARAQDPEPPPPPPSAALFNGEVVQRLELRVNTDDWEKLKREFQTNEYYPADVVFNGQVVRNAGIRSRGLGSRSGTKPGLRVDFDRYADDQTFLGLKSFVLDNLVQDPSAIHETLAMKLFARLGIPAPREAHVRLYVNDRYVGLYAVVESIDKDFLARIFGVIGDDTQNDGYLFEFNYLDEWKFGYLGPELEAYAARFDPKTNEKKSNQEKFGPIENLVRLANDLPAEDYMSALNDHLDLQALVRYVAAQNFVSQNDGFLGYAGMNNFYFYRLENSSRHVFLAWDEDNAFSSAEFALTYRHDENVLMRKAMQVPELRDLYYATLREAMALADEPTGPDGIGWLEVETRRQLDLIFDALNADPVKPYTMETHETARAAMVIFAQQRSRNINEQLSSGQTSLRRP